MFETDKHASGLIAEYEALFAPIRQLPIGYLEIGIHKGGSLDWAAAFFDHPNAVIVGIDRQPPDRAWPDRVTAIKGEQAMIGKAIPPRMKFDIIIDDGCHLTKETAITFDALWPLVKSGGWYIIEDWGAAFLENKPAEYQGMPELMMKIASSNRKDITEMRIINKRNGFSMAAFKHV